MTHLILFILATCGLTSIIVESEIVRPVREWLDGNSYRLGILRFFAKIVSCHQCAGFWAGAFCSPLVIREFPPYDKPLIFIEQILAGFIVACAGSFVAPLFVSLRGYFKVQEYLDAISQNR